MYLKIIKYNSIVFKYVVVDEASKTLIKDTYLQFDKTLLIKDPRRTEAKK